MDRIEAFHFMPFHERARRYPGDYVIGLRFKFDEFLIELIKDTLRPLHKKLRNRDRFVNNAGGWLPAYKCWFCEAEAWETLREVLKDEGFRIEEQMPLRFPECFQVLCLEPPVSEAEVKRAYRYLSMRRHPDRGGTCEDFLRLHSAYQEALDYVA